MVATPPYYLIKINDDMITTIHIKKNKVFINSKLFFEQEAETPTNFLSQLYKHLDMSYPKFHKMDALCKLGVLSTELLLQQNDITKKYDSGKIGIVLSNAASSIETDRQHQLSITDKNNYFPSPAVFVYTLPNIVIGEMAIKYKITGENTFLVSESFDADLLINYANTLFIDGSEAIITGWVEQDNEALESFLFVIEKNKPFDISLLNQYYHQNI